MQAVSLDLRAAADGLARELSAAGVPAESVAFACVSAAVARQERAALLVIPAAADAPERARLQRIAEALKADRWLAVRVREQDIETSEQRRRCAAVCAAVFQLRLLCA